MQTIIIRFVVWFLIGMLWGNLMPREHFWKIWFVWLGVQIIALFFFPLSEIVHLG